MKMLREFFDGASLRLVAMRHEKGQTTIEYILVLVLIVLSLVTAVNTGLLTSALNQAVEKIANALVNGA
jgi:Flp pilus assembly pilin Flp